MKDSKQQRKYEGSKSDDQEVQTGVTKCVECKDKEKNAANKQEESSPKAVLVTIGSSVCIKEWLQFAYPESSTLI